MLSVVEEDRMNEATVREHTYVIKNKVHLFWEELFQCSRPSYIERCCATFPFKVVTPYAVFFFYHFAGFKLFIIYFNNHPSNLLFSGAVTHYLYYRFELRISLLALFLLKLERHGASGALNTIFYLLLGSRNDRERPSEGWWRDAWCRCPMMQYVMQNSQCRGGLTGAAI